MNIKNALAGVAVSNLALAVTWYERLLGPARAHPVKEVAEWEFENGGWLQLFQDEKRAGGSSVTFPVEDLKAERAKVEELALEIEKEFVSELVDTMVVKDPDGNQIVFAETHTGELAK